MPTVKERISSLFPGDANKKIRHRLYSAPGFLDSPKTDDEIFQAAFPLGDVPGEVLEASPAEQEPENAAATNERMALATLEKVRGLIITNEAEFSAVDSIAAQIKKLRKENDAERKSYVDPYNARVQVINADFRKTDALCEEALGICRSLTTAYQRKLAEQREKAEAEARAERARLEAKAKAKAAEELAKLETLRKEQDALNTQVALSDFDALLAEDRMEEVRRQTEEQRAAAQEAIRNTAMLPEITVPALPKVTGSGTRTYTYWDAVIEDESLVPEAYWIPRVLNLKKIESEGQSSKGTAIIPGVSFHRRIESK